MIEVDMLISSESGNYPLVLVDCSDVLSVASFTGTFYSNNTAERSYGILPLS